MFARFLKSKHAILWLPGFAITIAYATLIATPQRREIHLGSLVLQQQDKAVDELNARVKSKQVNPCGDHSDSSPLPSYASIAALERSKGTFVQAFAQLVAIFKSNEVSCISASPGEVDAEKKKEGVVIHRLILVGSFRDVLVSLESIETGIPQTLAAELVMTRLEPAEPCRWEIAFQFKEGVE